MLRRALSAPLPLLLIFTALFTFLIQSGELGTSDTTYRLQVTHSLWTGLPQVFPGQYPEFGLHGRNGHIYAWFGIGQSLLMVPADLLGSAASHLPIWRDYVATQADPAVRSIVVSFSTNILLNVLTALVVVRFLGLLGFTLRESTAGALSLLFATTHLHYAQNMQENNYILLLTLIGFTLQLRWLQTGERRALFWGAMALGLDLLTRLTTGLDLIAVSVFSGVAFWLAKRRFNKGGPGAKRVTVRFYVKQGWAPFLSTYLRTVLPVYAGFFLLDRVYQWIRFGSWTNTYVSIFAREERQIDPMLPLKYPFSGHFFAGGIHSGLIGPFLNPEKSVFLFDPLFELSIVITVLVWKRMGPQLRAFAVTSWLLVLVYLLFYARYFAWAGDFAWGDRYVSSAFELSTLLAWPLLLRHWKQIGRGIRALAVAVTSASVVIQCASLAFWLPLEIYQEETFGHPTWVIWLRFRNIVALALGKREAWGLTTPAMFQDPWDAQHITSWYFLPSLLRHIGVAPMWAVHVLYGVWIAIALALVVIGIRLIRAMSRLSPGRAAAAGYMSDDASAMTY
jgi:hypothetical protein